MTPEEKSRFIILLRPNLPGSPKKLSESLTSLSGCSRKQIPSCRLLQKCWLDTQLMALDRRTSGWRTFRGELMEKAVRYLDSYRTQIFRYTRRWPVIHRQQYRREVIRPLAGERRNSLFFGSHRMAGTSAVYHTIISTCRLSGFSALEYLRQFFQSIERCDRFIPPFYLRP